MMTRSTTARRIACVLLAGLVVFALALFPRVQNLDQYVTVDEDLTLGQTGNFADAVATGLWRRTYQIGHPEVTVMWIATLVLQPEWAREFRGSVRFDGEVHTTREVVDRAGFMAALVRARWGMALANSVLIAVAALLVWRIAGPGAGLLGGALLALEPFLVAHGQLLRADALLAELLLVALLAAVAYWLRGAGPWALVLASSATGLALLTKTPSVVLLPIISGVALLARRRRWALGGWLAGIAVVYVALWPSMWVRPLDTLDRVVTYTTFKGGSPMDSGSYLLGEAMADPGPLFYLLALVLRASPALIGGLLLLLWWRGGRARSLVAVLLLAAACYGAAMALAPKKADRYVLPLFPLLATLAGLGIAEAGRRWRRPGLIAGLGAVVLAQALSLLAVWPYPLAYYNPLAGGGPAASRLLLVGWGEGLDVVARVLNREPDAPTRTAAVFYPDALDAQYHGEAVPIEAYDVADFAVLYIAAEQRDLTPPPLLRALADRRPDFEVTLNGIQYARVYRLARPEFGPGVVLDGVVLPDRTFERGQTAGISLRWVTRAPSEAGIRSRVSLLRADGGVAAESAGADQQGPLPAGRVLEETHRIKVPDIRGRYAIGIALETVPDYTMLPVVHRPPGLDSSTPRLVFRSLWIRVQ